VIRVEQVRVVYHDEDGTWWAESPDVAGYSAAAESLAALHRLVHEGLPHFLPNQTFEIVDHLAQPQVWRVSSMAALQALHLNIRWGSPAAATAGRRSGLHENSDLMTA
jgi:predicted RNase H-like HicB family nuclease